MISQRKDTMIKIQNIELPPYPLALAPMEDITDSSFRLLCKRFGADLLITEFISSEGLIRDARKSVSKLHFEGAERPLGIQIFGHDEVSMQKAVEIAESYHPDFIDINWGCPVRKVISKGAGAGILRDIPKMVKITEAVVKTTRLPVTVKTRLGWDETDMPIVEIAERLQDVGIAALSIHGRTRAQLYKGTADWTLIDAVKNNPYIKIPIFGNGDIDSAEKALGMKQKYNVDGMMIGRAAIGNPWIFQQVAAALQGKEVVFPNIAERVSICREHFLQSIEDKGENRAIPEMRKHYGGYFRGIPDFKPFRMKLVLSLEKNEILDTFDEIQKVFSNFSLD